MKSALTTSLFLFASVLACFGGDQWLKNIEDAHTKAKEKNLPILVEFTGSDWCPPCKAIANDIFDTKEFSDYSSDKLILVKLDFPRKTPQEEKQKTYNRAQANKYKIEAFPTIILISPDGKELARTTGYSGGKKNFYDWVERNSKGSSKN